jgi:methanogenic corrinoid protein MtbC1
MDEGAKQASRVVESVAQAIANWTIGRHAELDDTLPRRYGPSWRASWITHTNSQIEFLVQAIAVRRAKLFLDAVHWTQHAFEVRRVDVTDLRNSLTCLREVLESELPAPVNLTASDYVGQALVSFDAPLPRGPERSSSPGDRKLVLEYLEAILRGRRDDAQNVVLDRAESGVPVPQIYRQVLEPAQIELGRLWHAGEINAADEHFASATTQSVMSMLRPRFTAKPKNGRAVVATSVEGDLHEIGVRMVADYFEIDGWNVLYLGANTPSADVLEMIRNHQAGLLAVSASTGLHVRDVGELIEQIRADEACTHTKVLVGGGPFIAIPDLYEEVGADGWAASAEEAVKVGNALISPGRT